MSILTLSPPAREILKEMFHLPEEKAIDFLIAGIKESLKQCELEILEYETKYGYSLNEIREKIALKEIENEFEYSIEKDLIKWEDLLVEKKMLMQAMRKIKGLIK
jgi:hypothetical protein